MKGRLGGDTRTILWICAAVLVVIVAASIFAPAREDRDPVPSTWNSGARGAKAAYLLLEQSGYATARWDEPAASLDEVDAAHTTLIVAESGLEDNKKERAGIAAFLNHGGRVLATGAESASMLPDANVDQPTHVYTALCYTTPQSLSPMGRAGQITMAFPVRWKESDATVDQACGNDAVVVHYPVGDGEVVWWSSATPLDNHGLRDDANLRLLLASVGSPGQRVLFDEYIHGAREDVWDTMRGTPVKALLWQLVALALLVILSFGRRSGPVRALARTTRTSPLEFAESMGALYQKAGAADVATGAAERRLMDFLHGEGGIPRETLRSTPEAIAAAVAARFFYASPDFATDLRAAREAEFKQQSAKSALELVRRIDRHIAKLTAFMTDSHSAAKNGETRD